LGYLKIQIKHATGVSSKDNTLINMAGIAGALKPSMYGVKKLREPLLDLKMFL